MGAPPDEFVGVPTRIPFPTEEDEQGSAVPASIVQISCGARFNMPISFRGKLYAWVLGPSCELGLGADVDRVGVPTLVRSVEFKKKGRVPVSVSVHRHKLGQTSSEAGFAKGKVEQRLVHLAVRTSQG
ncbi:hypothetical protein OC861_006993 [Tilletia horrida]|nr:hypothetical protein OC861_006993 [Tilletia horrida]